jgi:hypothetical protein
MNSYIILNLINPKIQQILYMMPVVCRDGQNQLLCVYLAWVNETASYVIQLWS